MAAVNATVPVLAGAAPNADYRPRTSPGQTTILQDSAVAARKASLPADTKPRQRQHRRERTEDSDLPTGAMFAASVAAANLPPNLESYEELSRRLDSVKVGNEPVPPFSDRIA